eukprot:scaffold30415_cov124-Isochrysis_galbana.AAC.5
MQKASPKRTLDVNQGKGDTERGVIPKIAAYATEIERMGRSSGSGGRRGRRQGLLLVGNHLLANGFGVGKDGGPGEVLGVVLYIGSGASGGTAILTAINGGRRLRRRVWRA